MRTDFKIIIVIITIISLFYFSNQSHAIPCPQTKMDAAFDNRKDSEIKNQAYDSPEMKINVHCDQTLGAFDKQFFKFTYISKSKLKRSGGSEVIDFLLQIQNKDDVFIIISEGYTYDSISSNILKLFSGSDIDVIFKAKTVSSVNIPPGTYTGSVSIKIYYALCPGIVVGSLVCLGERTTPGGSYPSLLTGSQLDWGSGDAITLNLTLTVVPDCSISTSPIDFGGVIYLSTSISKGMNLSVNCSSNTEYSLGLNKGSTGSRQMQGQSNSSRRINYEIYKGSAGTAIWGDSTTERWISTESSDTSGNNKSYSYRAVVPVQTTPPPDVYKDTITIDLAF